MVLDAEGLPRILVYAEFDIVPIFDHTPQVTDAYRIQVFVVVTVEEVEGASFVGLTLVWLYSYDDDSGTDICIWDIRPICTG